jgi:hypothetical protein
MSSQFPTSDPSISPRWTRWLAPRRHRVAPGVLALIVVGGVIVAITVPFGGSTSSGSGVTDNQYPISTQTVTRETLSSQTQVSATLGYAGSYSVTIPTGTTASVIAQAHSSVQDAETAVSEAKAALANAEATARPQNASTLLAAKNAVSADETTLQAAKAQLVSDDQLGCPASSSSTVTSPASGSTASSYNGNSSSSSNSISPDSSSSSNASTSSSSSSKDADALLSVALTSQSIGDASAPDATTGAVDQTTSTSTTVTGTVSPNGTDTTYEFEYGTSPDYGETTRSTDAGSGTSTLSVSESLTGLAAGATYHYRLVATNTDGTTYGQDATFETNARPTVTTGAATSVSATAESLAGAVNPNGLDTTYFFEYGPTASLGEKTGAVDAGAAQSASSVNTTVSGLVAGKTYDYTLVATNALGTVIGTTQTFQAADSSCVVQRAVIDDDLSALSEAQNALQVDVLGQGSSVTTASQALAADEATANADEQALRADESQAVNSNTTFTAVPAIGAVIRRGETVYSLNGQPVPLFYGTVTLYRALSIGVSDGPDVQELEENLVALGFEHGGVSDQFTSSTEGAVKAWQGSLGEPETGVVALGDVVVEPGPIEVATVTASAGTPASAGAAVLTATSTTSVVTVDLDPSLQSDVKAGDPVTITLPNNENTPGVVSSVGTVATSSSGSSSNSNASSSSGSGSAITVLVTPTNPGATAGYDQAPVNVSITNSTAPNVLAVPVDALLALASGGYAVEEIGSGGIHHLVAVSIGLFDDQAGMVQVSGSGLAAGQTIVVPNV